AADVHQALDVSLNFAPQIALYAQRQRVNSVAQPLLVVLAHALDAQIGTDPGVGDQLRRRRPSNAEDVGQRDLNALFTRQIDAGDTGHVSSLSLNLFMFR